MSTGSRRTSSPAEESTHREIDDALKAVIRTYVGSALTAAKESGSSKRAQNEEEDENSPSDSKGYPSYGRIYGRQDDPFTNIDTVVNFGIKYEITEEDWENGEEQQTLSTKDGRLLHSWELLCSIIPDFRRQMLALSDHRKLRKATCQQATMRNKLKNDRGFYHPVTASLLCPIKYPDTPETYADIKAGKLPLTAELLPRFLFPHNHIYDPTDISKDLLCGHVMYRAAKHIFQGPSSALEEPGAHRGKQGNAAICGITSLSPRMIAYVAIQVRFALSSATAWVAKDGTFSYTDFYWHIVGLLDDEDDLESQETIRLFNYHVFGAKSDSRGNTSTDATEVEDEFELIKKQRAAKRARLSQ
ncbi:hypothetical protein BJ912DRAFT_928631 [Pholiota molesta]|nr:hypothetical protein BJ912DRAFT_928631 [Pholiota molesta]